jgi:hypothetical protein
MAKKEELKIPSSTCEKANGISGRMNIRKHVGGTPDDMSRRDPLMPSRNTNHAYSNSHR